MPDAEKNTCCPTCRHPEARHNDSHCLACGILRMSCPRYAHDAEKDVVTEDPRDPTVCPRCGEVCKHDGWDHVHANGVGIGSCRLTVGTIRTHHPEHYLLVNESDGTQWRLTPEGRWTRDLTPDEGSGYCPDACTWPHDHRFERDGVPWPNRRSGDA